MFSLAKKVAACALVAVSFTTMDSVDAKKATGLKKPRHFVNRNNALFDGGESEKAEELSDILHLRELMRRKNRRHAHAHNMEKIIKGEMNGGNYKRRLNHAGIKQVMQQKMQQQNTKMYHSMHSVNKAMKKNSKKSKKQMKKQAVEVAKKAQKEVAKKKNVLKVLAQSVDKEAHQNTLIQDGERIMYSQYVGKPQGMRDMQNKIHDLEEKYNKETKFVQRLDKALSKLSAVEEVKDAVKNSEMPKIVLTKENIKLRDYLMGQAEGLSEGLTTKKVKEVTDPYLDQAENLLN